MAKFSIFNPAPIRSSAFLCMAATAVALLAGCNRQAETVETTKDPADPELLRPPLALNSAGVVVLDNTPYTGVFEMPFEDKPKQARFRLPFREGRIHGAMLQFSRGGSVEREYHIKDGQWRTILGRYSAANQPSVPWGPMKFVTQLKADETPPFDPGLSTQEWFHQVDAACHRALVGPHLRWFEDGTLEVSNSITGSGALDGIGVQYDPDGKLQAKLLWEDGALKAVLEETETHKASRLEAGLLTPEEKAARDEQTAAPN